MEVNLNDEITSQKKTDEIPLWKKKLIISAVIAMSIIIILVVILLAVRTSNNDENDHNEEFLGEINCQYKVEDTSKKTLLLGGEFQKNDDFEIFIDKKKIKYSKEYEFDKPGTYQVQFRLYSNKINMDYMFKSLPELYSVIMLSEDDVQLTSMISTFENCSNLNDLTITGYNTDNLISMNKFLYRTNPNLINLNSFSTKNVEDMSFMFSEMSQFDLDLSKFDTSHAKNMSHMFYKNNGVYRLDLSRFNTSNVEDMSHMFDSCESLMSLNLENFDTSRVTDMSMMFKDCVSLSSLELLNFNTKSVTDMSHILSINNNSYIL